MTSPFRKAPAVFSMAASSASILLGYKMLRSAADSLFLAEFGASRLPYIMTAVPIGVALAMFGFSHLLKKYGPFRAFVGSGILSALLFLVLYGFVVMKVPYASAALYLVKEVYIVLLIAQHWSFINSVVTAQEGKVLNGPVLGIAQGGSLLGGLALAGLPERFGSAQMIPVGALFTLVGLVFVTYSFRREGEAKPDAPPKTLAQHFALDLLRKERTVLSLAMIVVATQIVSILLELAFLQSLQAAGLQTDARSAFLVRFWNWIDVASLILAFGVTPVLLARLSLKLVHYLIPAIHLLTVSAVAVKPGLTTALAAFFTFKALDYNVFGPAKEILYVPLSFDTRYRAKQLIDSVVYRTSKGVTSGLISIVTGIGGGFAALSLSPPFVGAALLGWLGTVRWLARTNPAMRSPGSDHRDV
jgi:AAA family ATP:ADP antiporter